MKNVWRVAMPVIFAGIFLSISVSVIFASPTYLPNGEFESGGANWLDYADSPGEVGTEQINDWGENCFSGSCLRLSDIALVVYQQIAPTERYVVVFAYLSQNASTTSNDACIRLRIGGTLYDSVCNLSNGEDAGWLWACFDSHDYEAIGSINLRLETQLIPDGALVYFDNVGVNYVHDCPGELELPGEEEGGTGIITGTCSTPAGNLAGNLLLNPSFEDSDNGLVPNSWVSDQPLYWPQIYKTGEISASNGNDYLSISAIPEIAIKQSLDALPTSTYAAGVMYRYVNYGPISAINLGDDYGAIPTSPEIAWGNFEFTFTVSITGARDYELLINASNGLVQGPVWLDLAYIVPITGTSVITINCPAVEEYHGTTGGGEEGGTTGPPISGGGGWYQCSTCPLPTSVLAVGDWLNWLACVLLNFFYCNLRTWIYNVWTNVKLITNYLPLMYNGGIGAIVQLWDAGVIVIEGTWGIGVDFWDVIWVMFVFISGSWGGLITWILFNIVNFALWLASWFVASQPVESLSWLINSEPVQYVLTNYYIASIIYEAGRILLDAILLVIWDIWDALIEMYGLLSIVFSAFLGSFTTENYEIVLVTMDGGEVSTIDPGALGATGPNATKILWLALAALATADYAVEAFPIEVALWLAIGALAFGLVMWTAKQWQEILPI